MISASLVAKRLTQRLILLNKDSAHLWQNKIEVFPLPEACQISYKIAAT
jgi:hypothetical protein